jgi:DNA-directed RNA polymerase subunit beta'
VFVDPLAEVEGETHGTDADAGDYLNPEASDE